MNYAPQKFSQITWAIAWFVAGYAIANIVALVLVLAAKGSLPMDVLQAIVYPLMFLPVFFYIRHASRNNSVWMQPVPFDRPIGEPAKAIVLGFALCLATFCAGMIGDAIGLLLPPVDETYAAAMEALTGGNVWLNILTTAVMAPILEEWFCRGVVERGILVCERGKGRRGFHPAIAISVSALLFAIMHGNIWQGVPAFLFGLLFGYVYYRTGSLKLTMLMHCFNNALSVFLVQSGVFEGFETWKDVMFDEMYWTLIAACAVELVLMIMVVRFAGNGRFWANE